MCQKKHNQSKNQASIEEDAPIQNIRIRLNIFIQWPETTQTYNYWSEGQRVTMEEESKPSVYSDYYNNYIRSHKLTDKKRQITSILFILLSYS
jgi:hypothetical protein